MYFKRLNPYNYLLSVFMAVALLVSCKNIEKKDVTGLSDKPTGTHAVEVTMENQVFHIRQENLLSVKSTFTKDSILLLFRADKNPFQLNLNLTHTDILNMQKATFIIPDTNAGKIKVDLNFFNADRDVSRINKRVVFKKGTIEIKKLTESKLEMIFTGEGSGMTERGGNFPISGQINATLNP